MSGFSIRQEIAPLPARIGKETVFVHLDDNSGKPVTNAAVIVEADMMHPGMSPVFETARETTPGNYEAQIVFSMGGDWVVLLHIRLADGKKIEQQMDVRGVRSNS